MSKVENYKYDDTSIDLNKGCVRIRKRPATMLGSSRLPGVKHGWKEIYGNALDEKTSGFGHRFDVGYYPDKSLSLRDYGRGVPLGWNDKESVKHWNYHVVFNELYGGGKLEDQQAELRKVIEWAKFNPELYNYLWSIGLNGLGAASTQYTSRYFIVKSYRDGMCTEVKFEDGYPVINGEKVDFFKAENAINLERFAPTMYPTEEPNGTFIHWLPDSRVFSEIDVTATWLFDTCKDIANVGGVEVEFNNYETDTTEFIPSGTLTTLIEGRLNDKLMRDSDGVSSILSFSTFGHGEVRLNDENKIWVCKGDILIAFTKSESKDYCFHNAVSMKEGVQYDAIHMAIRSFITENTNVKLETYDFRDKFMCIISSYSNIADLIGQTKEGVGDTFIRDLLYNTILNNLRKEYKKGNKLISTFLASVIEDATRRISIKSQISAQKEAKKAIKEQPSEKFKTCKSYDEGDYDITEVFLAEGDSAGGACKSARNSIFQAVYYLKGKPLNVLKASDDKIRGNKEIRELFFSVLGCGYELDGSFDITRLRVKRIIFATDGDTDGFHIRALLLLMFIKLAPQLVTGGYLYIAETPRFGLDYPNGQTVYTYNDAERDQAIQDNRAMGTPSIRRYKGLGELPKERLSLTTLHPDTRKLIPLQMEITEEINITLDVLFGSDKYNQKKNIFASVFGSDFADALSENEALSNMFDSSAYEDEREYSEM